MKLKKKNWLKPLLCLTLIFSIVISVPSTAAFANYSINKEDLQYVIDISAELTVDDNMGTDEDWTNLQIAIVAARDVITKQDANETEVLAAYNNLINSVGQVVAINFDITISMLDELVAEVDAITAPSVATDAWNYLQESLAYAKEILANPGTASQFEISIAYFELLGAMYLVDVETVYSQLQALIDEASSLKESDYTAGSWTSYQVALKEAKALLNNPDADGYALYVAFSNLEVAKAGLVKVTTSTGSSSSGSLASNSSKTTSVPKTGDTAALSIVSVTILAAAALVILKKKKIV